MSKKTNCVTMARGDLVDLLARASEIVAPRSPSPQHRVVELSALDGVMTAGANAGALMARFEAPSSGTLAAVCVGARDLLERARAMPSGDVTISESDGKLSLKSGNRRFSVPTQDVGSMPDWESASVGVEAVDLASVLAPVVHAASTDETRQHLAAVWLEIEALRTAATDGHRMAMTSTTRGSGVLVPRRIATIMAKAASSGTVSVAVGGPWIHWSTPTARYRAMVVDSQPPPYEQVVPDFDRNSGEFDAAELVGAVKAVALASDKNGIVEIRPGQDAVVVSVGQAASDVVPATGMALLADPIGCASAYLVDAVSAAASERVEVMMSGALDPIVVRRVPDDGARWVVMPARLG